MGGQPVLPVPAHSPVGFSREVGWGAGPEEAGPEEGKKSCEEASYQPLGILFPVPNCPPPPISKSPAAEYTRDGKMMV